MLEITDLHAGYGPAQVLHGVDLTIEAGRIVTLLGSNGAGKSTLNNNISGIYRPFSGHITWNGDDITGRRAQGMVDLGIVQVPEGRRIFPNLSVRENLELGAYRRARRRRSQNLEWVTTVFPQLRERYPQSAGTLSGGEQQMLAIARGLMAEPRLLILDEPSLGLSPRLVEELFGLIRTLNNQGLSIFLVEQNVVQSLEIADWAYVLENGRITMSGSAATLIEDPNLKKVYLGL